MKVVEFGPAGAETMMLLHGGGLSWWNYREAARRLAEDHRVLLPVLSGHAGSDRPFVSIEDNAQELLDYIDDDLGGRLALLGGLSLGGQVALEMLARRPGLCRAALIESASVLPDRLTRALAGPAFGSSYGLIQNRRFARWQARSLGLPKALFEDYYRDTCAIAKGDLIAFVRASTGYSLPEGLRAVSARVQVLVGEKESRAMRRSAESIARAIPASELEVLPGLRHGELSLCRPADYARRARELLGAL